MAISRFGEKFESGIEGQYGVQSVLLQGKGRAMLFSCRSTSISKLAPFVLVPGFGLDYNRSRP